MTETNPQNEGAAKPAQEVSEETRETLAVIEQVRKPRPEKMASERAHFAGAHEVRFSERSFRPRHGASLDEVRDFVDSLVVQRRDAPLLPTLAAPEPVVVEQRIPDHYRLALEPVIHGALVKVETVHRVGTGTVVDVEWEGRDEATRRGLYIIEDGQARRYEDVASSVDALPAPIVAPAPPASTAAPRSEASEALPAPSSAPAPPPSSAPSPAKEKKKRFGFGRK